MEYETFARLMIEHTPMEKDGISLEKHLIDLYKKVDGANLDSQRVGDIKIAFLKGREYQVSRDYVNRNLRHQRSRNFVELSRVPGLRAPD